MKTLKYALVSWEVAGRTMDENLVRAELDLDRGFYGNFIFGMEVPVDDLRAGFQHWLRPEYYAEKYAAAAKNRQK